MKKRERITDFLPAPSSKVTKIMGDKTQTVYYGEEKCTKPNCSRWAYYQIGERGKPLCGFHCKNDVIGRVKLPTNPKCEELEEAKWMVEIERVDVAARANVAAGVPGKLVLMKQRMMQPKPRLGGFVTVLPNYRAGGSSTNEIIWAFPALSPMKLGPVVHHQPGLPPSQNLENFHQFNKVFASEYDRDNDQAAPEWYIRRLKGYNDTTPHRHKLGETKQEHIKAAGGDETTRNANHCQFSIYITPTTGKEARYSYLDSRMFYCTFYEHLASQTTPFKILLDKRDKEGINLVIAGYDAREVTNPDDITEENLTKWYKDPDAPFGHEMVLCTMLLLWSKGREAFPWVVEAKAKLSFDIITGNNKSCINI